MLINIKILLVENLPQIQGGVKTAVGSKFSLASGCHGNGLK